MESTLILSPKDFEVNDFINKDLWISVNKKSLILGNILDEESCPVKGAVIVVYKQFLTGGIVHREIMGFTETDENGKFAILVDRLACINYLLEIYKALNNTSCVYIQ